MTIPALMNTPQQRGAAGDLEPPDYALHWVPSGVGLERCFFILPRPGSDQLTGPLLSLSDAAAEVAPEALRRKACEPREASAGAEAEQLAAARTGPTASRPAAADAAGQPQLLDVLQLEDAFYQKGTEFEKQQLQIVEKLERAHEDLARQWQELDDERKKSTQQQQQQRQLLAREQAELAKCFKEFEAEMEKRYSWQQEQKHELEEQWQLELAKRRQSWESEQEKGRLQLQQCFHELEEQLQGKLEAERGRRAVTDQDVPVQESQNQMTAMSTAQESRVADASAGTSSAPSDLLQPKLDPEVRARLLGLTPRTSDTSDQGKVPAVAEPLAKKSAEVQTANEEFGSAEKVVGQATSSSARKDSQAAQRAALWVEPTAEAHPFRLLS